MIVSKFLDTYLKLNATSSLNKNDILLNALMKC